MKVLLVVYDNCSYISEFPIGLAYIASVLLKEGHSVEIYTQDLHHYPDSHLTEYLNAYGFDVIGVSVVAGYYQYRKLLAISEAINKSKNRPFYVIGGHGPAPEPVFFMQKTEADAVVIGEGERTVVELMRALEGNTGFDNLQGLAFRKGDKFTINQRRALIENIDTLPMPAYALFPIDYYRLVRYTGTNNTDFAMPILSGRGCTFKCTFCYRMDEGFRARSNASIIEELEFLISKYRINYFAFYDELLMSSIKRVESLCRDFIKAKLKIKWSCNGRLNYARPEVLKLMRDSGCVFINYGIEAMDDQVLKNIKKGLTTKQIKEGVEATLKAKISPGLNIIFGNIGDTKVTLDRGVEFLLKYDNAAQLRTIRPVTPYPGSPLYDYAVANRLIKDIEDFYEHKHINSDLLAVNFMDISDEEAHRYLLEANTKLIKDNFKKREASVIADAERLYLQKNSTFRGFRQT